MNKYTLTIHLNDDDKILFEGQDFELKASTGLISEDELPQDLPIISIMSSVIKSIKKAQILSDE